MAKERRRGDRVIFCSSSINVPMSLYSHGKARLRGSPCKAMQALPFRVSSPHFAHAAENHSVPSAPVTCKLLQNNFAMLNEHCAVSIPAEQKTAYILSAFYTISIADIDTIARKQVPEAAQCFEKHGRNVERRLCGDARPMSGIAVGIEAPRNGHGAAEQNIAQPPAPSLYRCILHSFKPPDTIKAEILGNLSRIVDRSMKAHYNNHIILPHEIRKM